jgi:hypothetical protein
MLSVELHAIIEVSGAIEITLDDVIRIRGGDESIINVNLDGEISFLCDNIVQGSTSHFSGTIQKARLQKARNCVKHVKSR